MNRIAKLALAYLLAVVVFLWGFFVGAYQLFPYQVIDEILRYARGDVVEETTLFEKMISDLDLRPARMLHGYRRQSTVPLEPVAVPALRSRRDAPMVYLGPTAVPGYRIIFGAMDYEETIWGGLVLDETGSAVHRWNLSTDHLTGEDMTELLKNMYGVELFPDGSVVFQMQDEGGGIVRVDVCGREIWSLRGIFHHIIAPDGRGGFWTLGGGSGDLDPILTRVELATGEIEREIDMSDVRERNPDVHIFDLQRQPKREHATHTNDVEPLTAERAAAFPGFEAGDLLVSNNTTNLVFVVDPDDLRVKWWRVGPWDRQHDPDWNRDGEISVFSNNTRGVGSFSNILSIDPRTMEARRILSGSDYDFFSLYNGMHEITDHGTILVTSSTQGRVFEVDGEGDLVFDFVNYYDRASNQVMRVSNATFRAPEFFEFSEFPTCD